MPMITMDHAIAKIDYHNAVVLGTVTRFSGFLDHKNGTLDTFTSHYHHLLFEIYPRQSHLFARQVSI
jgi:hypothetical protein